MHAYRIVWEDAAKGREIELFVRYRLDDGGVNVGEVRPTQVTLYSAHSKRPARTIPVHTPTGRKLLAQAYLTSRQTEQSLEDEILAAHALREGDVAISA
jgi:hypothetical protein